jgi:hypothetical protein
MCVSKVSDKFGHSNCVILRESAARTARKKRAVRPPSLGDTVIDNAHFLGPEKFWHLIVFSIADCFSILVDEHRDDVELLHR